MTVARVVLDDYTSKVLNVIKAKYNLKDKSEAVNKFAELYGEAEVEHEVKDSYIKKLLEIEDRHFKKQGYKTQTVAQLRKEIEGR